MFFAYVIRFVDIPCMFESPNDDGREGLCESVAVSVSEPESDD